MNSVKRNSESKLSKGCAYDRYRRIVVKHLVSVFLPVSEGHDLRNRSGLCHGLLISRMRFVQFKCVLVSCEQALCRELGFHIAESSISFSQGARSGLCRFFHDCRCNELFGIFFQHGSENKVC